MDVAISIVELVMYCLWQVLAIGAVAILVVYVAMILIGSVVDSRRHSHAGSLDSQGMRATPNTIGMRKSPFMGGGRDERIATFYAIAQFIRKGDPGTFSGKSLAGWLIRIPTLSTKSHAFIFDVDDDPLKDYSERIWIIDSTLRNGVTRHNFYEAVCESPGQWYWGEMYKEMSQHYRRDEAINAAMEMVNDGAKYSWMGIVLQTLVHVPFGRELVFFTSLSQLRVFHRWPFCSDGLDRWMKRGRFVLCCERDSVLITPQDVNQCAGVMHWTATLP